MSEDRALKYLFNVIATFVLFYHLNILLLDRTNELLIDVFHFDDTWESAPIFTLTFGSVITIVSLSLMHSLIVKNCGKRKWFDKIPPVWFDIETGTAVGM